MNDVTNLDQARKNREQAFGGNGGNGRDDRLRQLELDIRELKTEQRHMATKEDLLGVENRLNETLSDIKATLAKLAERADSIKEHYASKWFILTSLIVVAGLVVAVLKLIP